RRTIRRCISEYPHEDAYRDALCKMDAILTGVIAANKNFNYVVVPGIKFREVSKESKEHSNIRGDFDGLYIKIPRDANAKIEMMVIEPKRRGNYSGKQLKRIIKNVGEEISDEEARKIAQSLVRKRRYENMYVNIKKIIGRGCKYIRLYFKI
ncbi:MAG: hypothetical protein N2V75_10615, partial [Methanophagales archaeon]|nr:hypothetical protein [Methanophagales archaeon]